MTIVLSPQEAQRLAELAARFDQLNEIERSEWYQLWVATVPRAIDSYYSLATPSAVPLYAGPLLFPAPDDGTSEQADGTVSLELAPRPRVLMRGPAPSLIDFQNLLDGARNPRLPPMSTLPPAPSASSETYNASWPGPVRGYVVGKPTAARSVTFLLVNFMQMLGGARITDGESHWPGRVAINVGPWMVIIDSRPDLRDVVASMRERGGYAVTHTGKLARRDGRPFAFARSEQFLTCLTWCLWFCRGSGASVFLPVGFDKDNRALWSRWAAPHTDPLPDGHWHWFDEAYGAQQLTSVLPLFFERWSDPAWQNALTLAIRYYIDAALGTLQRNVILAQVALESLAFTHLVTSSKQLQAKQFTSPVSRHIRHFLGDLGISTTIPRSFSGLRAVRANSPWDGPAAIAWLRNDIVHAANHKVHGRRWQLWYQGWRLSMWYLELAVLAVLKYEGCYRNRISGEPMTGAVEPVPWA